MACDSDVNILKHKSNKKTLALGKMAHDQLEMGVANKITSILILFKTFDKQRT